MPWSGGFPDCMEAQDVAVFRIVIPPEMPSQYVLDDAERARAARFLREVDRIRFTASHRAVRQILGRLLGEPPERLQFETGQWGKPALAGCQFNLSHSGGLALLAVSHTLAVGADVEQWRADCPILDLAQRTFHPQEAAVVSETSQFFRFWSLKEAFMKLTGQGFHLPPDRFRISPDDPPRLLWSEHDAGPCSLHTLAIDAGYSAALAVGGEPRRMHLHTWKEDVACTT
ncbi:MAG: 4'-phosphopantetheinyl transferase family protein [Candidatus Xenobia bacterium]